MYQTIIGFLHVSVFNLNLLNNIIHLLHVSLNFNLRYQTQYKSLTILMRIKKIYILNNVGKKITGAALFLLGGFLQHLI